MHGAADAELLGHRGGLLVGVDLTEVDPVLLSQEHKLCSLEREVFEDAVSMAREAQARREAELAARDPAREEAELRADLEALRARTGGRGAAAAAPALGAPAGGAP